MKLDKIINPKTYTFEFDIEKDQFLIEPIICNDKFDLSTTTTVLTTPSSEQFLKSPLLTEFNVYAMNLKIQGQKGNVTDLKALAPTRK